MRTKKVMIGPKEDPRDKKVKKLTASELTSVHKGDPKKKKKKEPINDIDDILE